MADCKGNERAANCDSVCCPTYTFNNGTYGLTHGLTSLQFWNEKRVRHALSYLLTINPRSESAENPVEEFAYASVASAAGLLSQIRQATARFNRLFPSTRWTRRENCRSSACREEGDGYSCYRYNMPSGTTGILGELLVLSGAKLTASQYQGTQYGDVWRAGKVATLTDRIIMKVDRYPALPQGYMNWVQHALAAIAAVPGGEPNNLYSSMTTYESWQYVADQAAKRSRGTVGGLKGGGVFLLSAQQGQVVAIDWLKQFLDVFAPPMLNISKAAAAAQRKKSMLKSTTMTVRKPTIKGALAIKEMRDGIEPERVNPMIIAGGIIVAGGAAFLAARRLAK